MSTMMQDDRETDGKGPFKGWHFGLIILGFFTVVFTVNGIFLFNAIKSFPGEDVRKSYTQGLDYNDTLAARASQESRGWSVGAGLTGDLGEGLSVEVTDRNGNPVAGLIVEADIRHPANVSEDRKVNLTSDVPGVYTADLSDFTPGFRNVVITGRWQANAEPVMEARKAIEIPGACDMVIPEDAPPTLKQARKRKHDCDDR
jgi:nitrogen fixation protein FixH